MNKRTVIMIAVAIVGIAGFLWATKPKTTSTAPPSNHLISGKNSKVTLIEYGDFECPGCSNYYPVIKQLKAELGDSITFQFRHFPLTQIHTNALAAHRAAEAANKQGKFWEMHDKLYEDRNSWIGDRGISINQAIQIFSGYAKQLGLNEEQFKKDFSSPEVNAIINADVAEGQKLKATSTPTFLINGTKLEELPKSYEDFKKLITDEIVKQGGTVPASNGAVAPPGSNLPPDGVPGSPAGSASSPSPGSPNGQANTPMVQPGQ